MNEILIWFHFISHGLFCRSQPPSPSGLTRLSTSQHSDRRLPGVLLLCPTLRTLMCHTNTHTHTSTCARTHTHMHAHQPPYPIFSLPLSPRLCDSLIPDSDACRQMWSDGQRDVRGKAGFVSGTEKNAAAEREMKKTGWSSLWKVYGKSS